MSISDDLMWSWWLLLTDLLPREIEALKQGHPMDAKKALAREIVGQFHGPAEGRGRRGALGEALLRAQRRGRPRSGGPAHGRTRSPWPSSWPTGAWPGPARRPSA